MSEASPGGGGEPVRWWVVPNWLGLDSPAVALAWTWTAGTSVGQELSWRIGAGFFLFVWSIYLADRLIDVARCPDWSAVPARLRFGRRHQLGFRILLGAALAGTVVLAWDLPAEVVRRVWIAVPGIVLYFALFVVPVAGGRKLPGKEFAIGILCTWPVWVAFGGHERFAWLLPPYAAVIVLNCLVIASRERELDGKIDPGAATAWWPKLTRDVPKVGAGLLVASLVLGLVTREEFLLGVAGAAMALWALHRRAPKLEAEQVRVLADACLLGPALLVAAWQAGAAGSRSLPL